MQAKLSRQAREQMNWMALLVRKPLGRKFKKQCDLEGLKMREAAGQAVKLWLNGKGVE